MKKTVPEECYVSFAYGQAKVTWRIDGQKYGLRLSQQDYERLSVEEGAVISFINTTPVVEPVVVDEWAAKPRD